MFLYCLFTGLSVSTRIAQSLYFYSLSIWAFMMRVSFNCAIPYKNIWCVSTEICTRKLRIYFSQSYTLWMNSNYMEHFTLFLFIEMFFQLVNINVYRSCHSCIRYLKVRHRLLFGWFKNRIAHHPTKISRLLIERFAKGFCGAVQILWLTKMAQQKLFRLK